MPLHASPFPVMLPNELRPEHQEPDQLCRAPARFRPARFEQSKASLTDRVGALYTQYNAILVCALGCYNPALIVAVFTAVGLSTCCQLRTVCCARGICRWPRVTFVQEM